MNFDLTRREFIRDTSFATAALAGFSSLAAEPTKKINIAFVGVAHIHTPGFIDLIKTRPDVHVKSVWDHDTARAEKRAKDLGAAVVKEADEIWRDPEISAVIICSETNRHHELVLAAAKAGKHMFAEKPLGITGQESREMAEAIQKANLLFTTGYFMRTDAKNLFLKDEIAKGHFGKITRARGSNCHGASLGGWFDGEFRWMADPKIAGVGAFGDLGTHKLDILMWLLGDVERVTADIQTVTGRYGDCDESGEGLLHFKNGTVATLAAGWVDVDNPVELVISGTEAHASIVDGYLFYKCKHLPGTDGKEPYTKLPSPQKAPMHQFFDAVAGMSNTALVSPNEAAARVVVMEAMYKGAKDKTWVTL